MNMPIASRSPQSQRLPLLLALAALAVLAGIAGVSLTAQVEGGRGIAAVASSTDIDVRGIEVNVRAATSEEARQEGWRRAQRIAWRRLDGPDIPESQIEDMVAAIVVEEETIGPRRYMARLGVIFDRQRAGGLLGASTTGRRSAPMLTLPVMVSGGTEMMFETRNAWQRAWAEHQFGDSPIDYVRPSGIGGESLLLTYGQTGRRSRAWWNVVLDEFSAADILVSVARLERQWPGGPVRGRFTARHGPDNRFLEEFAMRAESEEELPEMLDQAVARFDEIYREALARGTLAPDPTLTLDMVDISPEIRALLEQAQAVEERLQALENGETPIIQPDGEVAGSVEQVQQPAVNSITVQAVTPDAAAFDGALTGVRRLPGVRGVAVTSTAIGGTSVLVVNYTGTIDELAATLRSAGWRVTQGNNALAIAR